VAGPLLGVGSALAVGPSFVVIVQQAATSGFAASFRVILGSATADLLLLLPALAFTSVLRSVDQGALWVGAVGAVFLCRLAWQAARDAVARSHRLVGSRGQAWFTAVSAVAFLCLAATLVARDVLPRLG
jgi:threonine/homoserine/homoserine lactone efflux protein